MELEGLRRAGAEALRRRPLSMLRMLASLHHSADMLTWDMHAGIACMRRCDHGRTVLRRCYQYI